MEVGFGLGELAGCVASELAVKSVKITIGGSGKWPRLSATVAVFNWVSDTHIAKSLSLDLGGVFAGDAGAGVIDAIGSGVDGSNSVASRVLSLESILAGHGLVWSS